MWIWIQTQWRRFSGFLKRVWEYLLKHPGDIGIPLLAVLVTLVFGIAQRFEGPSESPYVEEINREFDRSEAAVKEIWTSWTGVFGTSSTDRASVDAIMEQTDADTRAKRQPVVDLLNDRADKIVTLYQVLADCERDGSCTLEKNMKRYCNNAMQAMNFYQFMWIEGYVDKPYKSWELYRLYGYCLVDQKMFSTMDRYYRVYLAARRDCAIERYARHPKHNNYYEDLPPLSSCMGRAENLREELLKSQYSN